MNNRRRGHIWVLSRAYGGTARICPRSVPVHHLYGLDNKTHGQFKLSRISIFDEKFTDLDSANDAVIFAETMEVHVATLDVLSKE